MNEIISLLKDAQSKIQMQVDQLRVQVKSNNDYFKSHSEAWQKSNKGKIFCKKMIMAESTFFDLKEMVFELEDMILILQAK